MANKNVLIDLDLNQNELQNAVIQNLGATPASPKAGQIWYNTATGFIYYYNGTAALPVGYLPIADASTLGGVKIGSNVDVAADGTISVKTASNAVSGIIRIATDAEISAGTSETLAVNPKQLAAVIAGAQIGALIYKGTWDITSATDFSGITLPVKQGWMYYVTGTGPKSIGGIEWNEGDYIVMNADVPVGGTITSVQKIDNTESSDIVRLAASQTLINKTIDADDNTISNLELDNFKSGVVRTSTDGIRASSSASDTSVATEKAISAAIEGTVFTVSNPSLTASSGVCTWAITNSIGKAAVIASIRETNSGKEVICDITYTASTITVKFNSANNIAANIYTAVVLG